VILTPAQIESFMRIANALSPENLHCDGEVSRAMARRRAAALRAQGKRLETTVGRSVTEAEVWAAFMAARRAGR